MMMNIFEGLGYYEHSVNDRDLTIVTKLIAFANNGHAPKGYTTEVEVGSIRRAPETPIRDYDHHDSPRTHG